MKLYCKYTNLNFRINHIYHYLYHIFLPFYPHPLSISFLFLSILSPESWIYCFNKNGETRKNCLWASRQLCRTQQSQENFHPSQVELHQSSRAYVTYFISNLVLAYNFFEKTFLGRLVKPIYQKYWVFEKSYHRDVLLQQGLVNCGLCRHSRIGFFTTIVNSGVICFSSTWWGKAYIHTIGFWRWKEEKDSSRLREVWEDFSYLIMLEIKQNLNLIRITKDWKNNGLHSPITIIIQIWPQVPTGPSFQGCSCPNCLLTMVSWDLKLGVGTSWTKEIQCFTQIRSYK